MLNNIHQNRKFFGLDFNQKAAIAHQAGPDPQRGWSAGTAPAVIRVSQATKDWDSGRRECIFPVP